MPLETATYVDDLVATNPLSSDQVGQGDDHLRLLKSALKATFPNFGGRFARFIATPNSYTVLSTDNTAVLEIPTAAAGTVTHTFSLPALSSITAGFYVDLFATSPTHVGLLVPTGGATIDGAATLAVGPMIISRVMYNGTNWRVATLPVATPGSSNFSLGGTLSVSGATHFATTLSVGGATTLGSTLTVSGAATMHGTLSVSGQATFKSGISVTGTVVTGLLVANNAISTAGGLSVGTTAVLAGAVTAGSTLTVSGDSVLQGNLHVDGNVTISSATTMVGTLSVTGAVHLKTTLSVGAATTLGTTLSVSGAANFNAVTISGTAVLNGGQLKFPATQNASADANTLDDYEEGTFTPTLTFATNGDFNVIYSTREGSYTKIGRKVTVRINIVTSTFTHSTASGNLQLTTNPFTPGSTAIGTLTFQGITRVNYTQFGIRAAVGSSVITFSAAGSGQAASSVVAADMPSGGTVILQGSVTYEV